MVSAGSMTSCKCTSGQDSKRWQLLSQAICTYRVALGCSSNLLTVISCDGIKISRAEASWVSLLLPTGLLAGSLCHLQGKTVRLVCEVVSQGWH